MHQSLVRVIVTALLVCAGVGPALAGPSPRSPAPSRPVVVRAEVDGLEPDRLVINGVNFGVTVTPVVLLAKVPLEVLTFSDAQIVVRLPIDAPPARYRLQVVAHGTSPSALFEVTLGRRPNRG